MKERLIAVLHVLAKPHVAIGGAAVLGALIIGGAWYVTSVSPSGDYQAATSASITEEVDVSGTVEASHSTDLAFETVGRIASINVATGQHVAAGQVLLALNGASQAAAVAGAKANLELAQAKLASLSAGTRPEQLAINQTAATQSITALANAVKSAYVAADDAVHVKADQIFLNPRTTNAKLSLIVPDGMLVSQVESERVALEPLFAPWQASIASDPTAATLAEADLASIGVFLDNLAKALAETPAGGSVSAATLASYQASVDTARTNVASALSAVTAADSAQKAAALALALAEAGASSNDIDAAQAAVDAAQAALQAAQASAAQTVLTAPVSGTITAQNANPGQTVAPGVALVSMIADGKFEADADISEADIGKVKPGQAVSAAIPSYPGVSFPATVTTVSPAATLAAGVSSYAVTVTFAENDLRLSPGATANLRIVTSVKDSALQVPSSAIITSGTQSFVYVRGAKGPVKMPVTLGIRSASGMTEITGGLTEGSEVLAFGANANSY